MNNKEKIILIDTSLYIFRTFYAMPELKNTEGKHTGIIFAIIKMIKKLSLQYKTNYIVPILDKKGKNFRHFLYRDYKANRKKTHKNIIEQIKPLCKILKKMGYPVISLNMVEADDVIGTLAKKFSLLGHQIIIVTSDKDMMQLVNKNINIFDIAKNKIINSQEIIKKFGIKPYQIADYLSLTGDKTDNIPGITKIGHKTAVKLLNKYESLQGIINNVNLVDGIIGENLKNSIKLLYLYNKLTTIQSDLNINFSLDDISNKLPDIKYLQYKFSKYEFKSLLKDQFSIINNVNKNLKKEQFKFEYQIILDLKHFIKFLNLLEKSKIFSFDTETNSLDVHKAKIIGIAFALNNKKSAVYIPLNHNYENVPKQLNFNIVISKIKPILQNKKIKKIAQNAKFDLKILAKEGINVNGIIYDTMIESYIYKNNLVSHDLNTLANKYLKYNPLSFNQLTGKGKKKITFDKIDIEKAGFYAAEDAMITYKIHIYLWNKIKIDRFLKQLYLTEELPISIIIAEMETLGVKINCRLLHEQNLKIKEEIEYLKNKCVEITKEKFNLSSPMQLRKILYEKMKLPITKKTPKGYPSTNEETLKKLSENYNLPKTIIQYRKLKTIKSTYTEKLPLMISSFTNRLHTSYNQTSTLTGRISSSNPNLQNIPIKGNIGRNIRKAFIAKNKYKIISADYSQIELRIMAHLSKDKKLIKDFRMGIDIHKHTASEILGLKIHQITESHRRYAKSINFGLIYGMGAFSLSKHMNISINQAQKYIENYFLRYPGVKLYIEKIKDFAKKNEFVKTIFGRTMYLNDMNSLHYNNKKNNMGRKAINAPIQGSGADIIKKAMIKINYWIKKYKLPINMIMQVHDELVFEVNNKFINHAQDIKEIMESVVCLKVPLIVKTGIGNNWNDAHK